MNIFFYRVVEKIYFRCRTFWMNIIFQSLFTCWEVQTDSICVSVCVCMWCKLKYRNSKIVHWNEILMINYCHPKTICHKMNTKRHDSKCFIIVVSTVSHPLAPFHAHRQHHKTSHSNKKQKSRKKRIHMYIFMCVIVFAAYCVFLCVWTSMKLLCAMCYVIHNVIRAIKLCSLFHHFFLLLLHSTVFVDTFELSDRI